MLPLQGVQVQSVARELRSQRPHDMAIIIIITIISDNFEWTHLIDTGLFLGAFIILGVRIFFDSLVVLNNTDDRKTEHTDIVTLIMNL